ncbi:hypothetical protein O7630_31705 [Micromonospora sp. WMMD718]|uniref:hypothetical protein n=1 Tax=Micromonospora sp. WMMD718 TaxID=3016098 RepID=UPI002416155F|nr:hypothetical protein [Micromonospora sp. WMMD718]MDG4755512.1 hypothetical protein [Micromonospora sp. WMMD718]
MMSEEKPLQVPVNVDTWRWPIRLDRTECGECGDALGAPRFTALSEVAEAVAEHAARCRAFS